MPGIADGSFGIEIAKQAHLPLPVIERAQEVLLYLKEHAKTIGTESSDVQELFTTNARLQEKIKNLEADNRIITTIAIGTRYY